MKKYIAFDIGINNVMYAIFNESFHLEVKGSFITPKSKLTDLYNYIDKIIRCYNREFDGIAISTIGIVDGNNGIIKIVNEIPYLTDVKIKRDLELRYKVPVFIENTVACSAISEMVYGCATGINDMIYVNLGKGISGAIVKDREIIKGKNHFAGEFGLMHCFQEDMDTFSKMSISDLTVRVCIGLGKILSKNEVFLLASEDNIAIKKIFVQWYRSMAKGIISLQYIYDPELIVIGGELGRYPNIVEKIEKEIICILTKVKGAKVFPIIKCNEIRVNEALLGAVINFVNKKENTVY